MRPLWALLSLSLLLILTPVLFLGPSALGSTRMIIGLIDLDRPALSPQLQGRAGSATPLGELTTRGGRIEYVYRFIDAVLVELPEEALPELATNPYIRFIEPDGEVAAPKPESELEVEVELELEPSPLGPQELGLRLTWEWLPWGVDRIDAEAVHHPPRGLIPLASLSLPFFPLFGLLRGRGRNRRWLLLVSILLILGSMILIFLSGCEPPYLRFRPNTLGFRGEGVKVALLDSGLDPDHPDLRGNYRGGYDFVNDDPEPRDDNGHGTEVAGVVAAEEDGFGLVGVAPRVELYAVKVLGSNARGAISDVIKGIEWAIQHGIKVVNLSLGTPEDSRALREAVRAAWEAGLVLVAAAGNESAGVLYPAAYPEVIAVSATTEDDQLAWSSNFGPEVDLAAPGEEVPTTYLEGRYKLATGTSFAAAHVTGVAALLISSGINDNREVRRRLEQTAEDLGLPREEQGSGLVDAARAVFGLGEVGDD